MNENENKENLTEQNKNDNLKRTLLSAVCVLFVIVVVFCVFLIFIYNKTPSEDSSAPNNESSASVPAIVTSDPDDDNSFSDNQSSVNSETADSSRNDPDVSNTVSVDTTSREESSDTSDNVSSGDESQPDDGTELDYQWYGYIYRYFTHALEDFTPSSAVKNAYIESINKLYEEIGTNKNFYHMIIPTQVEFLRSAFPPEVTSSNNGDGFYNQSQAGFISMVSANTVSGIKNIDVINTFKQKYDSGQKLFFDTDKNYTSLGAYYAYTEFCKSAGINPVLTTDFSTYTIDNFLGTFYSSTGSQVLASNPDSIVVYDTAAKYDANVTIYNGTQTFKGQKLLYRDVSYGYNTFLGREAYRYEVEAKSAGSEKSILVIGDGSAAPIIPYLAAHYKNITFLNATKFDDRYYDSLQDFLNGKNYDDVLVVSYSTSYKSPFFFGKKINAMLGIQ